MIYFLFNICLAAVILIYSDLDTIEGTKSKPKRLLKYVLPGLLFDIWMNVMLQTVKSHMSLEEIVKSVLSNFAVECHFFIHYITKFFGQNQEYSQRKCNKDTRVLYYNPPKYYHDQRHISNG